MLSASLNKNITFMLRSKGLGFLFVCWGFLGFFFVVVGFLFFGGLGCVFWGGVFLGYRFDHSCPKLYYTFH